MPSKNIRPYLLSIAGFDPSGGAGVLADIKTFESYKTIGLAVSTSITFQNESHFEGVQWISFEKIEQQLEPLFAVYKIEYVKIGLIESFEVLNQLIDYLFEKNNKIKIIWDPILKASAGFSFHNQIRVEEIERLCSRLYMITPNWDEIKILANKEDAQEAGTYLSQFCQVYLKGGHNEDGLGKDYLFTGKQQFAFRPKKISEFSKHGTGCVLSAALTANLAKGFRMHKACLKAKEYVLRYLESNQSRLGYHQR